MAEKKEKTLRFSWNESVSSFASIYPDSIPESVGNYTRDLDSNSVTDELFKNDLPYADNTVD